MALPGEHHECSYQGWHRCHRRTDFRRRRLVRRRKDIRRRRKPRRIQWRYRCRRGWTVRDAGRHRSAYAHAAAVHGYRCQRGLLYGNCCGSFRWYDDDHRLRDSVTAGTAARCLHAMARMGRKGLFRLHVPCCSYLVGRHRPRRHGHARQRPWCQQLQTFHGVQRRHHV